MPFGDYPLVLRIVERVVLDVGREPLVLRVHRRALRHRKAQQQALVLEAQVVVLTRCVVMVDQEQAAARGSGCPERLARRGRFALAAIFAEIPVVVLHPR